MSKITVTLIKQGRRTYGGIYTLPSGVRVYLAHRKVSEIFRSGKSSISEAIRESVACWAFDETTCLNMRAMGIKHIGVLVRETGDRFLTKIENLFDPTTVKIMNYTSRGGALQRYLPLKYFTRRPGKIARRRR